MTEGNEESPTKQLKREFLIAGEEISLTLENLEKKEQVKMPLILATFLMNNGLARKKFSELSDSRKKTFIEKVREAKVLHRQLEITMRFLGKTTR